MQVFTVFCQKPLLRPFFQMDIHVQLHSLYTCTAAQLIYMYSVLCLVYMAVRTQACFCKGLLNFFCSEILVSDLKMYNLTSPCFAGTKIRIINLVFSVSLKKE